MDGLTFRDLEPGDLGWVIQRHGELYWRDEGYDLRFEALVARVLADFIETRTEQERAWIAVDPEGRRVGCIFCARETPIEARLRMFLVEPDWRGTGLAQALLNKVVAHGRNTGARRLILSTHESHRAAGRLYARNGFRLRDETPVVPFGQSTLEQHWALDL